MHDLSRCRKLCLSKTEVDTENRKSRERLAAALSHRQPDSIPIDFGGTNVTGMHVSCVAALRDYYGLEKRLVRVLDSSQMLGLIEEDLLDAMGIDVIGVFRRAYQVGIPGGTLEELAVQRSGSNGSRRLQYHG